MKAANALPGVMPTYSNTSYPMQPNTMMQLLQSSSGYGVPAPMGQMSAEEIDPRTRKPLSDLDRLLMEYANPMAAPVRMIGRII